MFFVDWQGCFVQEVIDFVGCYVKDYGQEEECLVDVDIVIKFKEENKLFYFEKYLYFYLYCWCIDCLVFYYLFDSWFVKVIVVKECMYEFNKIINWKLAFMGENCFGKWLENLQDWNFFCFCYWGIFFLIWCIEDVKEEKCVGLVEELCKEIEKVNQVFGLSQEVLEDLYWLYIDDVVLVLDSGQEMCCEFDFIDVWFDFGFMFYVQWYYLFENKEVFECKFLANFIVEGVD